MLALNRVCGWRMSSNTSHTPCVTVATSRNSFPEPGRLETNFDKVVAIMSLIAIRASPEAYLFSCSDFIFFTMVHTTNLMRIIFKAYLKPFHGPYCGGDCPKSQTLLNENRESASSLVGVQSISVSRGLFRQPGSVFDKYFT